MYSLYSSGFQCNILHVCVTWFHVFYSMQDFNCISRNCGNVRYGIEYHCQNLNNLNPWAIMNNTADSSRCPARVALVVFIVHFKYCCHWQEKTLRTWRCTKTLKWRIECNVTSVCLYESLFVCIIALQYGDAKAEWYNYLYYRNWICISVSAFLDPLYYEQLKNSDVACHDDRYF